jgi:hypothetical protein
MASFHGKLKCSSTPPTRITRREDAETPSEFETAAKRRHSSISNEHGILADIFRVGVVAAERRARPSTTTTCWTAHSASRCNTQRATNRRSPTATRPLTPLYLSDADTESVVLQDSRVATAAPPWRGSGVGDRADDAAVCVAEHAQFFATTRRAEPRVGAMALFSFLVRPDDADLVCKHRMVCIEDAAMCDLWRSYALSWCQAAAIDLKPVVDRIRLHQQQQQQQQQR